MSDTQTGWSWWTSQDAETYTEGPFASRAEAVEAGMNYCMGEHVDERGTRMLRFYITEARQAPLNLGDWIDVDDIIQRAEEQLSESDRTAAECDEGPFFDYPGETFADLEARIKQACTDWQAAHSLIFTCKTFSASRSEETICVPARDDEGEPS